MKTLTKALNGSSTMNQILTNIPRHGKYGTNGVLKVGVAIKIFKNQK